jgi:hypothetical protein
LLEIYGSLGIVAGLAQVVYLGAAFSLSAHLLARSRRAPDSAPLMLGLNLLLAMGLGYLLISIGVAMTNLGHGPPPAWVEPIIGAGYAATCMGLIAALLFTRRVFRAANRTATFAVWVLSAGMWIGWAGYGLSGGFAAARFEGGWLWLMLSSMLATNLWVAVEPLTYYGRMRRRLQLGLTEPIVAERFVLWGAGSLARALMIALGPAAEFALGVLGERGDVLLAQGTLTVASLLGLFTSVAYWLTFCPTDRYRRWVDRRFANIGPLD